MFAAQRRNIFYYETLGGECEPLRRSACPPRAFWRRRLCLLLSRLVSDPAPEAFRTVRLLFHMPGPEAVSRLAQRAIQARGELQKGGRWSCPSAKAALGPPARDSLSAGFTAPVFTKQ